MSPLSLGTLADIRAKVKAAGYTRTALILVGRALGGAKFTDSRLYAPDHSHVLREASLSAVQFTPITRHAGPIASICVIETVWIAKVSAAAGLIFIATHSAARIVPAWATTTTSRPGMGDADAFDAPARAPDQVGETLAIGRRGIGPDRPRNASSFGSPAKALQVWPWN